MSTILLDDGKKHLALVLALVLVLVLVLALVLVLVLVLVWGWGGSKRCLKPLRSRNRIAGYSAASGMLVS